MRDEVLLHVQQKSFARQSTNRLVAKEATTGLIRPVDEQSETSTTPTFNKSVDVAARMFLLFQILLWSAYLARSMAFETKKLVISPAPTAPSEILPLLLTKYPLFPESLVAGSMACLGDFLAQRIEKRRYDPIRTGHFLLKGLGEGVLWSFWYRSVEQWSRWMAMVLASFLKLQAFEVPFKITVCIILDLLVACPIIYGLWDIPIPALLRGERNIIQQVRSKLPEMVFASVKLWLPVNIVIYNLPTEYRVYISSATDVFWQSIVSSISSRQSFGDVPKLNTK